MKATIWHNSKCGTSRKALAILEEAGVDVTVVDYQKNPPSRDELKALFAQAGISARQGLRTKQAEPNLLEADDEAILDAMMATPILIERPLVRTEKGVRLCRPLERIHEIL